MEAVGRREYVLSWPGFVADPDSVALDTGRQIDWEDLAASFEDRVPAGTVIVEQSDGTILPRSMGVEEEAATLPAVGILVTSTNRESRSDALSGYGVIRGGVIYSNLLQETDNVGFDDWIGELQDNGTGYVFKTYADNRGG